MSNVIHIDNYRLTTSDVFFFDNNIWMYLYCPIGNYASSKQRKYSSLLEQIRNFGRPIFLNALILSEFTNAWLRMEFYDWVADQQNSKGLEYKRDFVGTAWYKDAVVDIDAAIKQIMKISNKGSDDFNAINIEQVLSGLSTRDFNDNYYLTLAQHKKWNIVTDDADLFSNNFGIKIITANSHS